MRPPLRDPEDPALPPTPTAAAGAEPSDASTRVAAAPETLLDGLDPVPPVDPLNPFALSPRERLFVEAFCGPAACNSLKAYELAGFTVRGVASSANASRLRNRPRVEAAIAARIRVKLDIMEGDEALEGISQIGRSDIRRLYPPDHWIAQLPDDIAFCIKSITPVKHGDPSRASGYRIELYAKDHALETIAKAKGVLKDVVEVKHSLEDILARSNQPDELGATA